MMNRRVFIFVVVLSFFAGIGSAESAIDRSIETTLPKLEQIKMQSHGVQLDQPVQLDDQFSTQFFDAEQFNGWQVVKVGVALVLVLIVILFLALVLRRINRRVLGIGNGNLKIVNSISLGSKEKLVIVELPDSRKRIVVGVTAHNISKIYDIPMESGKVRPVLLPNPEGELSGYRDEREPNFGSAFRKVSQSEEVPVNSDNSPKPRSALSRLEIETRRLEIRKNREGRQNLSSSAPLKTMPISPPAPVKKFVSTNPK